MLFSMIDPNVLFGGAETRGLSSAPHFEKYLYIRKRGVHEVHVTVLHTYTVYYCALI